jgi:glycopeptide antibiotics resistance protein
MILDKLVQIFFAETRGIGIRNQVLLLFFEALIVFIPGFFMRKKGKTTYKRLFLIYLFLVYIGVLVSLTLLRRPAGSREDIIHLYIQLGLGIKSGRPSLGVATYAFYNVLLFVPMGLLVFQLFRDRDLLKNLIATTLFGAALSWLIECTQYNTGRGMFEVTDLFTNTVGCFLGALIALIIYKRYFEHNTKKHKNNNVIK